MVVVLSEQNNSKSLVRVETYKYRFQYLKLSLYYIINPIQIFQASSLPRYFIIY